MRLLLDTHIWIWLKTDPARLPSPVRRKLASDSTTLCLSAASVMEISLKRSVGKLKIGAATSEFVEDLFAKGAQPVAVGVEHALAAANLPPHHRDPFDRTLIAQAQLEGLTLVTADRFVLKYDVPTIDARK